MDYSSTGAFAARVTAATENLAVALTELASVTEATTFHVTALGTAYRVQAVEDGD